MDKITECTIRDFFSIKEENNLSNENIIELMKTAALYDISNSIHEISAGTTEDFGITNLPAIGEAIVMLGNDIKDACNSIGYSIDTMGD